MTRRTPGDRPKAASIRRCRSGDAASPISRLRISIARTTAMHNSSPPIASVPSPSKTGLPVTNARTMPSNANSRPSSAPESSSSRTGSSGLRDSRMYLSPAPHAPMRSGMAHSGPQGEALKAGGKHEDRDRHHRGVDVMRVGDLLIALVDREHAAEREEHDGDDERPEVPQPPVPELVQLAGRPAGLTAAQDQQPLVARVGDRVDRLG